MWSIGFTNSQMPRTPALSSAVFAVLSVLYPVLAVVTIRTLGPNAAFVALLALIGARLLTPFLRGVPSSMAFALAPVLVGIIGIGIFDRQLSIRLYPVFMSLAMLAAFAATLFHPPSMIERFARVFEPDLPDSGVLYTYRVTLIWIGFFAINAAIALWTVAQSGWSAWTLYNGFISYVAAGALLGGEYVVRQFVRRDP
jgi:uncharacterized membrane protein